MREFVVRGSRGSPQNRIFEDKLNSNVTDKIIRF